MKKNKNKNKNKKGFTLIELLAVIVILGLLMAIAIPSVTKYITQSRKKTVTTSIENYIGALVNEVNDLQYTFTSDNTIYAVPIECISLERGGTNPFGNWYQANNAYWAYVLVQYDDQNSKYIYGYTFKDSAGYGLYPTIQAKLKESGSQIKTGLELSRPESGSITTITNLDNWNNSGFEVDENTKLIVLEAGSEGEIGDGKETCTLAQKGTNYEQVEKEKVTLYQIMKEAAVSDAGIDFNVAPTSTTSGVFLRSGTENNANPIYYYRGIVNNNNVIFANFCWKIVRTTETGGIKIIYNGTPTDGKCTATGTAAQIGISSFNSSINDNAYVGYMYGTPNSSTYEDTHKNTNNSTMKIYIDSWYKTNIDDKGYTEKLEDTVWCNDRSFASNNTGTGKGKSITYYDALNRLATSTPTPSLECKNINDRFTVDKSNGNGDLTYPVALLTADEVLFAGIGYGYTIYATYLYTGSSWWSLSPKGYTSVPTNYANVFLVYSTINTAGNIYVNDTEGVRPSVSLKPGTRVANGDGTADNPYILK